MLYLKESLYIANILSSHFRVYMNPKTFIFLGQVEISVSMETLFSLFFVN